MPRSTLSSAKTTIRSTRESVAPLASALLRLEAVAGSLQIQMEGRDVAVASAEQCSAAVAPVIATRRQA